ncbi:glycoside hydrolase family protein [Edaphovirga cremea]|uniref:glycoside hydrolase family protein n=1 Tax=Edaphovirga cremea TaxID=2267246 RepID=UPI000DEFC668|nr:glycoside hydrolase family protein [Edaphovirga cremea]
MNQKSEIIPLLEQEEGTKLSPYIDSLGYPTVGTGFKIGPQGAPLRNYVFDITQSTCDAWLQSLVDSTTLTMSRSSDISATIPHCNQARQDILTSMAYQMGVEGLAGFHNMLNAINRGDFDAAASEMLNSTWAKQTPERAQRHAAVMKSGSYEGIYSF